MRKTLTTLSTLLLAATLCTLATAQEGAKPPFRIHSATDIAHEFTFYFDGRFAKQYVEPSGGVDARIWCTLAEYDLARVNLLVLPTGATPCPYTERDLAAVRAFLEGGGGVVVLGSAGTFRDEKVCHANELAGAFGARFTNARAKRPITAAARFGGGELESYGGGTLALEEPDAWEVLARDVNGEALLARRGVGTGQLLVGCYGLNGRQPDAKDPINTALWQPLLLELARGKAVDRRRRPEGKMPEQTTVRGELRIEHSSYLAPMAALIAEEYERSLPILNELCGVPPSPGMLAKLILLPTGGGGFSSGAAIGLGVWWGDFPEKRYPMIELIGHEAGHSWVLPFAEPMWNEPIATYIGARVGERLGYGEEARGVIARNIAGARKLDPELKKYDIAYGEDVPNAVVWGKTMWIWERLREERPDALARYFRAKRRLIDPEKRDCYTPDDCAAVMSAAMGRDLFPWLRSLGLTVDRSRTAVPIE